jgi:hypothetical protein
MIKPIDSELRDLSGEELLQLFEILKINSPAFEAALHTALTMIRANRRAQGGRG